MWFQQIVRTFFYSLDNVLFNFIPTVYDLLISISRTSILSQGQIKQFADRIELFLGIFMLFKVSFSLITYILNPDEFSDKSKGFGKLWMNIIVSLIMLVIVPYIFNMAYQLQAMLLEENTLAIIILGETEDNANANYINTAGDKMAYTVMLPFFLPNYAYPGLNSCVNLTTSSGEANEECFQAMYDIFDGEKDSEGKNHSIEDYKYGILNQSLGLTFRLDTAKITVNGKQDFLIDYKFFISTAVAIVVLLLLISFCLDVALRSVKLSFLQLIYPIPVISYIDPKSGKDGLFKKWYEMCFKTYISLFVRLVALYFGIYIISKVNHLTDIINGSRVDNFAVKVFINIGVLFFIKQLPKILEGLGIKLDGDAKFQLNPFKKFEEGAIGGKRITGAIGGLTSGIADRGARIMTAKGPKDKLKAAAGGLIGIPGAAIRGARNGKGFKGGMDAQNSVNRRLREGRIKGLTPAESYLDYVGSKFGLDDATLEREGTYIHETEVEIANAKRRIDNNTRQHTLKITSLEQSNAVRKDTQSKIQNAKSKADQIKSFNDDYLKKKANFGKVALNNSDSTVLNNLLSNLGQQTASDITLSDGHVIKAGRTIDSEMLNEVRRIGNKNYTANIKENNNNLELMKKLQPGESLKTDVRIGSKTFYANSIVDGDMLQQAEQAANDYEKYATGQLQNLFSSNSNLITDTDATNVFNNLKREYKSAVDDANNAIRTYNTNYNTNVGNISSNVDFKSLDSTIKNLEHGKDVTDIGIASDSIERLINDEKRIIENYKHIEKVNYKDKNGNIIEMDLDQAELLLNPRKDEHKDNVEKHQQRRSLMQDSLGNK